MTTPTEGQSQVPGLINSTVSFCSTSSLYMPQNSIQENFREQDFSMLNIYSDVQFTIPKH